MDHLLRIRDSFIGYLTPQAKRRHTTNYPATSDHNRPFTMPGTTTEPNAHKSRAVLGGRVSKQYVSNSDKRRSAPGGSNRGRVKRDGTSYIEEDMEDGFQTYSGRDTYRSESLHPDESASQVAAPTSRDMTDYEGAEVQDYVEGESENKDGEAEEEEEEEEEEEQGGEDEVSDDELNLDPEIEARLAIEERVAEYLANQAKHAAEVRADLEKASGEGWHDAEVELFERLAMRGYEPLLPMVWARDFRTLPSHLFGKSVDGTEEETVINSVSGNNFRATTALKSLITLGGLVRGQMSLQKYPEHTIAREVESFFKWAERDGGYHKKRFLPIHSIYCGNHTQTLKQISKGMTDQLKHLALLQRQFLALPAPGIITDDGEVQMFSSKPPLLMGLLIAQCVVVFVSLDANRADARVRTIASFNFSDADMDVWNGFAVAIFVIMVRDRMVAMLGDMGSDVEEEESDPDA